MELRQLRYFILLARELNFSRAAEKLFISQPTLSQQIAAMESELGGKLFERNKREVSLTESGKLLLDNGEDLLYQFDSLVGRIQSINHSPQVREVLSIGVDTYDHDLDRWDVIQCITRIHRIRPRAEFRFLTVPFKSIRTALENRDIDVGFYTLPKGAEEQLDVHYKVLRTERISVGVPEDFCSAHPNATLTDVLDALPIYLREGDLRWNSYFERILRQYHQYPKIKYCSDGLLDDYILAQLGCYLNTETLFKMQQHRFPVRELVINDDSIGAMEVVIWDDDADNDLRTLLFNLASY